MKNAKLYQLLAMVIASSTIGARGLACIGNCHDYSDLRTIPILPASSGPDGGPIPSDSVDALCHMHCANADSCKPTTIPQPDGTSIQALSCESHHTCGAGRRPEGFVNGLVQAAHSDASWIMQAATLEAASVDAFRWVRRDLRAHGAPRRLLRQASRAMREEKRHARCMRALARRLGIAVHIPKTSLPSIPSLEQMATHNAVEGCIRETFGALMAQYQARHAQNPEFAAAMKTIAVEEAHHAALAYRIDVWARKRLDVGARQRIDVAQQQAIDELLREAAHAPSLGLSNAFGLPDACTTTTLLRSLVAAMHVRRA